MNELNLQIQELVSYDSLCNNMKKWDEALSAFSSRLSCIRKEYDEIEKKLSSTTFSVEFPIIEQEINRLISQVDVTQPITLLSKLDPSIIKLEKIANTIINLEGKKAEIQKMPDRYQAQQVVLNISQVINKLKNIRLSEIDDSIQKDIPQIKAQITNVLDAFSNERITISKLHSTSQALLEKVQSHYNHQNRFKLHEICHHCEEEIKRIITQPKYLDLDSNFQDIKKLEDELDNCELLFYLDLEKIQALCRDVNKSKLWEEDYDLFLKDVSLAEKDIFSFPKTSETIIADLNTAKSLKSEQVNTLLSRFMGPVKDACQQEISAVMNNCVPKYHLFDLEAKLKSERKRFLLKVTKWVGIIIAIVVLIAINLLGNILIYVGEGIIVLIILYLFFKDD